MQTRDKEKLKLIYEKFPSQMSKPEVCYATEHVYTSSLYPTEIKRVKSITINTDGLSEKEKTVLWGMLSEINRASMTSTWRHIHIHGSINLYQDRFFSRARS